MNGRPIQATLVLLILILCLACVPAIYTQTNPPGPHISGEFVKYGHPEVNLVILKVRRRDQAPTWKAEFEDGTNENIVSEDIPGLTILKWKIDQERMKTITKTPYKLRIHSEDGTFETTVSFTSAGRDFTGKLILNVVVNLITGR